MERVLILGSPGSGKSTLARALAHKTGMPLIHLDQQYWRSGWVEPSPADWSLQLANLLNQPHWIMDGNYGGTLPQRAAAADTLIFLDMPRLLCLQRSLLRTLQSYGRTRDDMPAGCPERFDPAFFLYIWRFNRRNRSKILTFLSNFPGTVILLRTSAEVEDFLRQPQPEPPTKPSSIN